MTEIQSAIMIEVPASISRGVSSELWGKSEEVLKKAAEVQDVLTNENGALAGIFENFVEVQTGYLAELRTQWIEYRYIAEQLFPKSTPNTRQMIENSWDNYLKIAVEARIRDFPN